MRRWLIGFLLLTLTGCATTTPVKATLTHPAASLPDLGPAPELTNDIWLNVDSPLRLADLRGKVIVLDMWTFG